MLDRKRYDEMSNSFNHSQLEDLMEMAMEEDMDDQQFYHDNEQIFNTQNFYNRQHFIANKVVDKKDK